MASSGRFDDAFGGFGDADGAGGGSQSARGLRRDERVEPVGLLSR